MDTGRLSADQEAYLDRFCADYVARTRRSQAQREAGWPTLADPRSSAGLAPAGPARDFWLATKRLRYPLVGSRSDGVRVWDADDNEYIDYGLGFGVHLFGHRPAFVWQAIAERLERGTPIAFQSEAANEVAEGIARLTGAERVAFANTGTEAVMSAVRLARAHTGRDTVVVFEHSYHGSYDDVMAAIGTTRGIPGSHQPDVLVLPYGEDSALERIEALADTIAAVLVEPVQARRPSLQPTRFLHQLRALTERQGIVLVFDDVLLGFRVHQGGCQAHFDVRADLATYGKVLGGGLPIGVVTGRTEIMNLVDGGPWRHEEPGSFPVGNKIWFAGTFNKNPLTMAATRAVVRHLLEQGTALQQRLTDKAAALDERLSAWLTEQRMPYRIARFGSMFRFESAPHLTLLIQHLHMRGIYTWEGQVFFVSTAHTDDDLDRLEFAVKGSLLAMRRGGYLGQRVTEYRAMRRLFWVLLAAGCFGTGLTVSRIGLTMFSPLSYTGMRLVVAALTFAVFYAVFRRRGLPRRGRLWALGLGLGILGTALPMLGIITALQHVSSGVASVVATSGPAFAVLFAHVLLVDEKITLSKSLGVALALAGAAALALQGETGLDRDGGGLVGYLVLVGALACSHLSLVLSRKFLRGEHVLDVVCIQMVGAVLFLSPLSLRPADAAPLASSGLAWFTVLFGGVVGTFLAFSARFKLVVDYGATDAALVDYVVPVVSTLTGAALAGERVTWPIVVSMAVILVGVRLVQRPAPRVTVVPPRVPVPFEPSSPIPYNRTALAMRAEEDMNIETRTGMELPEVDLRVLASADQEARRAQAATLDRGMRETGFCLVDGHGLPQDLFDRMLSVTREFFDLPVEEKTALVSRMAQGQFCGYVPFAADAASRVYGREGESQPPEDLRERFRAVITECEEVRERVGPCLWPQTLPALQRVWTEYYRAMEGVGERLMSLAALALQLDADFFHPYFDRHFSVLMSTNSPAFNGNPRPGQARCGTHTDTGTMTFVYQPPGTPGGIEVMIDEDNWLVPKPRPGTFIVNCGDLLARWTNGRWRSTIHRVGGPGASLGQRRQSLVFFHQPALDVTLTCLPTCVGDGDPVRFEPITLRQHFNNQQRRLATKDVATEVRP